MLGWIAYLCAYARIRSNPSHEMSQSSSVSSRSRALSSSQAPKKVLVIGKGAREPALVWKLAQSPIVEHVYVAPGNGGTAMFVGATNLEDVKETGFPGLVDLAKALGIGLVIVGPDDAVVAGIEKHFRDGQWSPLLSIAPWVC